MIVNFEAIWAMYSRTMRITKRKKASARTRVHGFLAYVHLLLILAFQVDVGHLGQEVRASLWRFFRLLPL